MVLSKKRYSREKVRAAGSRKAGAETYKSVSKVVGNDLPIRQEREKSAYFRLIAIY